MRVIFLDINGVLNCVNTRRVSPAGFLGIDDKNLKILKEITDRTGAVIVLVSCRKNFWHKDSILCAPDGEYINKRFKEYGLEVFDKVTDHLVRRVNKKNISGYFRGNSIMEWLSHRSDVESWIVIDDDVFIDYEKNGILPHLVRTDMCRDGLSSRHVETAIELLGGDKEDGSS